MAPRDLHECGSCFAGGSPGGQENICVGMLQGQEFLRLGRGVRPKDANLGCPASHGGGGGGSFENTTAYNEVDTR